jgi:hypothetical protein
MRRLVFIVLTLLPALGLAGQTLSNDQFAISYSGSGLTSLKRVHDAYDTDYIAHKHVLGDLSIRYRKAGETAWQQALDGYSGNASGQQVSYVIGRALPTLATSSKPSSSVGRWGLSALNDQLEPENSTDVEVPFFVWSDRHGTEEWVQYEFSSPQQVSSADVYWLQPTDPDFKVKLPSAWRIQYRDGDQWKDAKATSAYPVAADRFNHVDFEPVTATAVRLTAKLPEDASSGILEWRLNNQVKQVEDIPDLVAALLGITIKGQSELYIQRASIKHNSGVFCSSFTSIFLRIGGSIREPGAKRKVKTRWTSFHFSSIPIHSPLR